MDGCNGITYQAHIQHSGILTLWEIGSNPPEVRAPLCSMLRHDDLPIKETRFCTFANVSTVYSYTYVIQKNTNESAPGGSGSLA